MSANPGRILLGDTPRLLDEWQEQPKLWNLVRREVDERSLPAQFILTGSANPEESVKMHSGAGRFTTLDMRTMSWQELGISSAKIKMKDLFQGSKIDIFDEAMQLEMIVEKIVTGGFPKFLLPVFFGSNQDYAVFTFFAVDVSCCIVFEYRY